MNFFKRIFEEKSFGRRRQRSFANSNFKVGFATYIHHFGQGRADNRTLGATRVLDVSTLPMPPSNPWLMVLLFYTLFIW